MKEPIDFRDIRKGDVIRWENDDSIEAHEYRAIGDGHYYYYGQHYLIEPRAVSIPTEWTFGWVETGAPITTKWTRELVAARSLPNGTVQVRSSTGVSWCPEGVASFTPATAVPTEALEELRAKYKDAFAGSAAREFLNAVDKAES